VILTCWRFYCKNLSGCILWRSSQHWNLIKMCESILHISFIPFSSNIMVDLFFLKIFTGDARHVYLYFWTMKFSKQYVSSYYKLHCWNSQVRNWFCLRELYCKHQCRPIWVYLHGLLYASIAANAMLHQLPSVFVWVRTNCLNNFREAFFTFMNH